MVRLKDATRAKLMVIHGFTMVALGLGLFYIRAAMTSVFYYVIGCAFAFLLVAASLLFIAVLDWVCAAGLGSRQIYKVRGLLILSTAAASASIFLILYPGSTIRMLCYLIALYAALLSIGKFRLAAYWTGSRREQMVMYGLAGVAIVFAGLLTAAAGRDEREALAVVAAYSIFMGLQMLLSLYYLQQQTLREIGPTQAHV